MLELWLSFMTGLAGSGHCLGMCGGMVAALAMASSEAAPYRRLITALSYHAGRIGTYTLLGLLAGALSQTSRITMLKPWLLWLFAGANAFVILIGLATALGARGLNLSLMDGTGWGFMARALGRASRAASPPATVAAGFLMGLIPCGMVYGVLITAATSGFWLTGGAMMLAFGLGTLPALLVYGQLASLLSTSMGALLRRLLGLTVALLGAAALWKVVARMGHH